MTYYLAVTDERNPNYGGILRERGFGVWAGIPGVVDSQKCAEFG